MKTTFVMAGSLALAACFALSPAGTQQKTTKECRQEWAANRAAIAAAGKTQRVFVAECRGVPLPASAEPAIEPSKGQFVRGRSKDKLPDRHGGLGQPALKDLPR